MAGLLGAKERQDTATHDTALRRFGESLEQSAAAKPIGASGMPGGFSFHAVLGLIPGFVPRIILAVGGTGFIGTGLAERSFWA
jgi:hypothetical protein